MNKENLLFEETVSYLYTKKRRDYIPVVDEELNKEAKRLLDDLYDRRDELQIPEEIAEGWDKVALYSSSGSPEKAKSLYLIGRDTTYNLGNKLNDLTSKEWLTESVTVFTQRGLGAKSKEAQIEKEHPAPFSFQDVARLIRFFTKKGNRVLDPFSGVASTLKACSFESREGHGIELNKRYFELGKKRIEVEVPPSFQYKQKQYFINGDSRKKIAEFSDNFFDFIVTSPPYWNILETIDHKAKEHRIDNGLDTKYSDNDADLANIKEYEDFLEILSSFFSDCSRILKKGGYMAIIVSDFRKKEKYYVFHADLAQRIEKMGNFELKGIRILYQKFKSIYPYGYPFSFVPNIHHQNVLILRNKK